MLGILPPGAALRLSKSDDLKRKLPYTIEAIRVECPRSHTNVWVSTNTQMSNRSLYAALRDPITNPELNKLLSLAIAHPIDRISHEVVRGNSRVDFVFHCNGSDSPQIELESCDDEETVKPPSKRSKFFPVPNEIISNQVAPDLNENISSFSTWVEVKVVTMTSDWYDVETSCGDPPLEPSRKTLPQDGATPTRTGNLKALKVNKESCQRPFECSLESGDNEFQGVGRFGLFPDSETARGLKHLEEMEKFSNDEVGGVMLFFNSRGDIDSGVAASWACDPLYARKFEQILSSAKCRPIGGKRGGIRFMALNCSFEMDDCENARIVVKGIQPVLKLEDAIKFAKESRDKMKSIRMSGL